jgi:CubicO group peptidase (beta-lactamase class C family)
VTLAIVLLMMPLAQEATAQRASAIDSLGRAVYTEQQLPGLVVGVADSSDVRLHLYGVATLKDSGDLHTHTRFEIGSVTKMFTGLLLATMAEQGAVGLDDPIGSYLPDSVAVPTANEQPIRLHHLITHTSGLPRLPSNFSPADSMDPYADYTSAQLYALLEDVQLSSPPGATYAYSNVGAGLLGHLLARHAGTTYAALLQEQVLQPLGLNNTGVLTSSDTERPHLAAGYAGAGPVPYWQWDVLAGAGALYATPSDLLGFLQIALRPGNHPLASALQETFHVRHHASGPLALTLGWHVSPAPDGTDVYWHNGDTCGFRSFIGMSREHGTGGIVLANKALPLRSFNTFAFQIMQAALPPEA